MRTAWVAFLMILLGWIAEAYEEKDFSCPYGGDDGTDISSTAVCDGKVDCAIGDANSDQGTHDKSPDICAPQPYLEEEATVETRGVTNMSAHIVWSNVTRNIPGYNFKLAGYIMTGNSGPHSFKNSISARLTSYNIQWLKAWTDYRIILRPFYTESGKPETTYKLGRAVSLSFRTLESEPDMPNLVSVLSVLHSNVVLNIVGPSARNSDPRGFRVRWHATSTVPGSQGKMDFALPAEWSHEENVLNVTLNLQGGADYRVSVRALGGSVLWDSLQGPEVEVNVSVPLDLSELFVNTIGPSTAVVTWRSSEQVDSFQLVIYVVDGEESVRVHNRRQIEGKKKVTSLYNAIITTLQPWTLYAVHLEGCNKEICTDIAKKTFNTPPNYIPAPSITRVEATGTGSFEVAWRFPQPDRRLYDGFRVVYCQEYREPCSLVHTKENNISINGMQPGTTVSIAVRAQLKGVYQTPLLGPPGTASVTTWTKVPKAQVQYVGTIEDGIGTSLLTWQCTNSSVDYLQYRAGDYGEWVTCNDAAECDANINYGRTSSITSGDMRLTAAALQNINVWIRCCNTFGCGVADSAGLTSDFSGPPLLSEVTVIPKGNSAQLRYVPQGSSYYDGIEVTWNCNEDKKATYYTTFPQYSTRDYMKEKTVEGLTAIAEQCQFFVSLYWEYEERRHYSYAVPAVQA